MDKTSTFKRVQTVHYPGQCTEKKRKKKKKKTRESAFVSSLTLATRHRFLVWCWKVEGGTNWRGWLAGLLLRAAFCGLRIPSRTTRGKTPLQHRDKSRGEARGGGGRDGRARGERRRERREPVRKNGGGKEKKKARSRREGGRGKCGGGQKDIRRN